MLRYLYTQFGLVGSVFSFLALFVLFIFWLAGISGIVERDKNKDSLIKLIIAALIPIYPICWMFYEMIRQHRKLKSPA